MCSWRIALLERFWQAPHPPRYAAFTPSSSPSSRHSSAKGLPYPKVLAVLDVVIEVLGPLALIIGLWPRWTAVVLVALTIVTAWSAYRVPASGAAFQQIKQLKLMMSLAVTAGLLFYAVSGPGAWSRTGLRRG